MPNFYGYHYDYISTQSTPSSSLSDQLQQMWLQHQQECDQQDREVERRWQEEEELREDKRKYPLFFIKDGIV